MKTEGEARIEGAKRPRIEGEARIEGAKRPSIEGKARNEGEVRDERGRGLGRGLGGPLPRKFLQKNDSEMVQSGEYFTSKLPDQAV